MAIGDFEYLFIMFIRADETLSNILNNYIRLYWHEIGP